MLKEPYVIRQQGTSNASTAADVTAPSIPAETVVEVYNVSLQNASGESVTVEFGITDIVGFRRLCAKATVASADSVLVAVDWFLVEGDKLTARVTGTSNKSVVTMYASGESYGSPSNAAPPAQSPGGAYDARH